MINKLKLIIFDCDGVMFDSKEANRLYYNALLKAFDKQAMTAEELEYVHMHNVVASVKHIFRHYPAEINRADEFRKTIDYRDFLPHMIIEPDLIEFLNAIIPAYKTAISTNRTTTMSLILKIYKLEPYFGKVVTPLDVKNSKPHPEALEKILAHFNLTSREALFIGDSMVDREHTSGVGMPLVAFKNPDLPAEYHVDCFMDILSLDCFAG